MEVELSSAWLVRVSDEPAVGTTDYCYTFTAKGRKKDREHARAVFIIMASIARRRVLTMTYYVSRRAQIIWVKPLLPPPKGSLSDSQI